MFTKALTACAKNLSVAGFLLAWWSLQHGTLTAATPVQPQANVVRSIADGPWSSPATWDQARVPASGDVVLIATGHTVTYDVESSEVLRAVHISGRLTFATDVNSRLEVGLLRVAGGDSLDEDGFECTLHDSPADSHGHTTDSRPELLIGTPTEPIQAHVSCIIRLHPIPGTDIQSWPAIVCCGGRMEIHGVPLNRTWVKLTRTADPGATKLFLADAVEGWKAGDQLVITGTARQEPIQGIQTAHVADQPMWEVRTLVDTKASDGASMTSGARTTLQIDKPLERTHRGGQYSAEVANLSRNVIIESAKPEVARGHTMFHFGSSGSISYAEFRHLGKLNVLGRYPIHYHLVDDSMRGSSVVGVSVWDSENRWVTIHGTRYLVVRDCVGFQSVGHGFFLEDGTETCNVLDRNLAIGAMVGQPLPKQVLPYDRNDGAGFWWANNLNALTRNVAVECDQHGFRFEVEKSEQFDPMLWVVNTSGKRSRQDIRTLPFLKFEDNEVHCQRRFGLNLGGIRGLTYQQFGGNRSAEVFADSIGGTTQGMGPDAANPLVIQNFKAWDCHWAFHTFCPTVKIDGLDIFDCNYGIWRSVMDFHQYDNLSFKNIHSHAIFFPMGGFRNGISMGDDLPNFPNYKTQDRRPPFTIVLGSEPTKANLRRVYGVSIDDDAVASVRVNGQMARSVRSDFAEWEIELPWDEQPNIVASATDRSGNQEATSQEQVASRIPMQN